MSIYIYLFCVFNLWYVNGQTARGDRCTKNGEQGYCEHIKNCPSAQRDLEKKIRPVICLFLPGNSDPLVCCVNIPVTPEPRPIGTTGRPTGPAELGDDDDPEYVNTRGGSKNVCPPVDPKLTSQPIGRKAWDKCLEYQQRLVYPCEESKAIIGGLIRGRYCKHDADKLIFGGDNAEKDEFPHMALLGFGEDLRAVRWDCGGSVISESFILTAGHCISDQRNQSVSYAITGTLSRTDPVLLDRRRVHRIVEIIPHDNYAPPQKYNDIALLRTERNIDLSPTVVPACLHIGDNVADGQALVSGWGVVNRRKEVADILQKAIIDKYPQKKCRKAYKNKVRLLSQGIDDNTQMCFGDENLDETNNPKDTCQGDSGGPLQIKSKAMHCMYTIIGVTSFGNSCGRDPGIYTRVAAYVKWIEDIVWP